jgi:hypothetical protein
MRSRFDNCPIAVFGASQFEEPRKYSKYLFACIEYRLHHFDQKALVLTRRLLLKLETIKKQNSRVFKLETFSVTVCFAQHG